MNTCPVCSSSASINRRDYGRLLFISCERCGRFVLEKEWFQSELQEEDRAIISFWIRHQGSDNNEGPYLESSMIKSILNNNILPSVSEKVDNLLRYVANNISNPATKFKISSSGKILSIIGAINDDELIYLIKELKKEDLINSNISFETDTNLIRNNNGWIQLTRSGWDHFESIKSKSATNAISHFVFMAMEFGNQTLDMVFEDYFEPAIKECGYELKRLDKHPKAGSIDDRIRGEIRASKFILADVTNDNLGAYWEAGFAEGANKTVIYLCEEGHFKNKKTHFDINHQFTVVYNLNDLESAMKRLKDVITRSIK